ncbi:MAG TPA: efflux RND transporter periplasmic adaptor subunit [Puia sp.]|jgi:multidrug efflux system membrane fusion protein|nr:efflux RND transporter periplasmic adaptor subunit [Puia sp.]
MNTQLLKTLRFPLAAILAFALVRCSDNQAAVTPAKSSLKTSAADAPATKRQAGPSEDPIPVRLQPVVISRQSRLLQYSGLIASNAEAHLSFKIGGIISKIYVQEGDHVAAGQLLATLDLTEIDAQVQQAAQNVEKSQRDESRLTNLYRDTVASLEQLQNSHTQLTVATEALHIARFNRQYAQIRAATSGIVLQKIANEGEYVAAGAAVLVFNGTDNNDWVVRFGVSDKDWAVLHKGDNANVGIDAYPDHRFSGVITKLAGGADPNNGTYAVEVTVKPAGHKLAPGLFCSLQLQPAAGRSYALIPASALTEGEGLAGFVYTLNEDKRTVRKIPVHIAFFQDDRIAISSGLDSVQEVIADGVGYLTERSIVKVQNVNP